jgi:hypothetical protein
VGVDEEAIVAAYLEQWPAANDELPIFRQVPEACGERGRLIASFLGIAILLAGSSYLREASASRASVPAAAQPTPLVPMPDAAVETGVVDVQPAAVVAGVRLDVQPTAECWVSAVADGEVVIHRLLQPGERALVGPARELVLRIGDPAAFAFTVNGEDGRVVGQAGIPVTITITGDNYRTFVDEPSGASPPVAVASVA